MEIRAKPQLFALSVWLKDTWAGKMHQDLGTLSCPLCLSQINCRWHFNIELTAYGFKERRELRLWAISDVVCLLGPLFMTRYFVTAKGEFTQSVLKVKIVCRLSISNAARIVAVTLAKERCQWTPALRTVNRLCSSPCQRMSVRQLRNTAQRKINYPTSHSIEREVRHKVLSNVHLSVCAVTKLDRKAEKDKIKQKKTIN